MAVRSPRDASPDFICPAFVATARSAIMVSSVSPLGGDHDAELAVAPAPIASSVSVSDPIWFTLTKIALPRRLDPSLEPLGVRDEQVVADQLNPFAERRVKEIPPFPIVLRERILERDDREPIEQVRPEGDHVVRSIAVGALEVIAGILVELASRGVERDRHLRRRAPGPRSIARIRNPNASSPVGDAGGEPTFIAHRRRHPRLVEQARNAWKHSTPQRSASENDAAPTGTA